MFKGSNLMPLRRFAQTILDSSQPETSTTVAKKDARLLSALSLCPRPELVNTCNAGFLVNFTSTQIGYVTLSILGQASQEERHTMACSPPFADLSLLSVQK